MIVIVDFGSQTAHMIGRRLKKMGIAVDICQPNQLTSKIDQLNPRGIILSGGPASVNQTDSPTIDTNILARNIPILGICYGWQLMAKLLGGQVVSERKEYGPEQVYFRKNVFGLNSLSGSVIMSHGDCVEQIPTGFEIIASTKNVACAAAYNPVKRLYGVQFHPELHDTEQGFEMLNFFVTNIAGCVPTLTPLNINDIMNKIRTNVGKDEVICAISGGVDSTVTATLIEQAIGRQLRLVYVENGLMRTQTQERVLDLFPRVTVIQAENVFLQALKGNTDPEVKRKTIGKLFIDLFEQEARKFPKVKFLAQGTIYSDVIESQGTKLSSKIKSHHNVGGLPEKLALRLLEPLREFYKDEVRDIGRLLKIPEATLMEHPFPGPGYAVRIRGEVTSSRLKQVKQADAILTEEMRKAGLYNKVFQCFPVMTGAYSTAVKGDEGIFAEVVAIRAYESVDIMTSSWARLPYDVLQNISTRIVNEVPHVSRVVYDISTKPPATMEWE